MFEFRRAEGGARGAGTTLRTIMYYESVLFCVTAVQMLIETCNLSPGKSLTGSHLFLMPMVSPGIYWTTGGICCYAPQAVRHNSTQNSTHRVYYSAQMCFVASKLSPGRA